MKNALKYTLLAVAGVLLAGTATFYFSFNAVIQAGIERFVPPLTGTPVRLNGVNILPLSGRGRVQGLEIGNPEGFSPGNALRVRRIRVELEPRSVFSEVVRIRRIELDGPEILYEEGPGGSNLSRILGNIRSAAPASKGSGGGGKRVVIDHFIVRRAKARYSSKVLAGKGVTLELPELHLQDIGKKSGGATLEEAAAAVFAPLAQSVALSVGGGGQALEKGVQSAGKAVGEAAGKLLKGVFRK